MEEPQLKVTYHTHAAEVITIHVGYEWGFFVVDEQVGLFNAQTSFGDFNHIWSHRGSQTLKQFLLDLDYSYFMGKTHPTRGMVYDKAASVKRMKERILQYRRERVIDLAEARAAREAIERIDTLDGDIGSEDVFLHLCYDDRDIYALMQGDFEGVAVKVRDPQCEGFWTRLWPHFIDHISKTGKAANDAQT